MPASHGGWRERLRVIVFEADTPSGKAFDVVLMIAIVLSVLAVMLESVNDIAKHYGGALNVAEWIFTGLFTVEYVLRLIIIRKPARYAFSFFGVVDLATIAPIYLSVIMPGSQSLSVIRMLRLLRVFRVLKLGRFLGEMRTLGAALKASAYKITVFLGVASILVTILGSMMYFIEGEERGFTSIPLSVYWAVVTLTTVGYGDLVPHTVLGRFLATGVMIFGYAVIAVPTGIVTAELIDSKKEGESKAIITRLCSDCLTEGHALSSRYCCDCGSPLPGL